jgi:hypothetical protein
MEIRCSNEFPAFWFRDCGQRGFCCRIGGEEFVVLLPASPLRAAVKVAERIRTLVEVAAADKALYEAKAQAEI